MLELAYRRHNALDSDLLRRQGASEFRKWHLRSVPSSSKIDKQLLIKHREEAMQRTRQFESPAMRMSAAVAAAALAGLLALPLLAQSPTGIAGVVAPDAEPRLVQDGLVVTAEGDLLAAEGDGKRISKRSRDGTVRTVTEGIEGKPLLAPNDLILDAKGGIYFTDPGPRPVVPGRIAYVYYLPAGAKQPLVIDDQIARPNGLTLTRDGKTLIVDDTLNPTVYAYDVEPDGSVKNKRTFAQLRDIPEGKESGADGMALDRDDRVFITTLTGVQVFDAAGKYLGTIKVARQPANVGFAGPDRRVLYITAREGLYRLDTLAQGPDRIGK